MPLVMRARSCAAVIGVGLMYLAPHMDAFGATITAPHSDYRPALPLILVRQVQNTGDFDAMMRQQFAQAQAQMEAAMREMQRGFSQIPQSRVEHHSFTSRQFFRGQQRDDDDDDDGDDTQVRPYSPPAPHPVMPAPSATTSPDDSSGWWGCIIGLFFIGILIAAVKGCINFARSLFGHGPMTHAPVFAPPPYQPAWPYQPPSPAQPAWPAKPAGPVVYDIPE